LRAQPLTASSSDGDREGDTSRPDLVGAGSREGEGGLEVGDLRVSIGGPGPEHPWPREDWNKNGEREREREREIE